MCVCVYCVFWIIFVFVNGMSGWENWGTRVALLLYVYQHVHNVLYVYVYFYLKEVMFAILTFVCTSVCTVRPRGNCPAPLTSLNKSLSVSLLIETFSHRQSHSLVISSSSQGQNCDISGVSDCGHYDTSLIFKEGRLSWKHWCSYFRLQFPNYREAVKKLFFPLLFRKYS